jgi:hypothetical protein
MVARGPRFIGSLAIATCAMLLASETATAACLAQNTVYSNQSFGTSCNADYMHGNYYTTSYSQIARIDPPPNSPYYCTHAGTKVTHGNPLGEGNQVWSGSYYWAQSAKPNTSIIASTMYAYRLGTYYDEVNHVPGIGC